jgi:hypothetical protein
MTDTDRARLVDLDLLISSLRGEARLADRPGQHGRLNAAADVVVDAVEYIQRLIAERDAARAEAVALRTQYRDLATYRTTHANLGLCPEGPDDEARDPDCPVCRVLAAHESGIRGRERAAFAALLDAEDDEDERTGR